MVYFNYDSATSVENKLTEDSDKESLEKTAKPCEPKSFWEEYDIWGDTDTIYAPLSDASEFKPENEVCEESIEPKRELNLITE